MPSTNRSHIDDLLSAQIDANLPAVLDKAAIILGKLPTVHSFNGIIGGKNNIFADCVRDQYQSPEEFSATWFDGLNRAAKEGRKDAPKRLIKLVQDKFIRNHVLLFQRRNFYRYYDARVRAKPPEKLWSIWFGGERFIYGLLISPVIRQAGWTNDKSEMRKAPYMYWTVGHILETGLINPEKSEPFRFKDADALMEFYDHVLAKVSQSKYEKGICDRYLTYLTNSHDIYSEPFLIPEFRFGGAVKDHQHRMDFTVFNSHVMKHVGFELSPHSSHMAVKKLKGKTMAEFNRATQPKWAKEVAKRNAYFDAFEIPTVTFADPELTDLDECFDKVKTRLEARQKPKLDLKTVLAQVA